MKEFKFVIKDPDGLHARPAGGFVKLAQQIDAKITVSAGNKSADAKKLFRLMGLGVQTGGEITITADGNEEAEGIIRLAEFCEANL